MLPYNPKEFSLQFINRDYGGILSVFNLIEYPFHTIYLYFDSNNYIAERQEISESDIDNIKNVLINHKTLRTISFTFLADNEGNNILDGYELTIELSRTD